MKTIRQPRTVSESLITYALTGEKKGYLNEIELAKRHMEEGKCLLYDVVEFELRYTRTKTVWAEDRTRDKMKEGVAALLKRAESL